MTEFLAKVRRTLRWHRRTIGIVAAVLCFMTTLSVLAPMTSRSGEAVVVASRNLAVGSVLSADDLQTVHIPAHFLPTDWQSDPAVLLGATTTGPIAKGSVFTTASTRSGPDPGDGRVVVPFRVADKSVVALIRVGDRISVIGTGNDGSVVEIATQVEVTALPPGDEGSWNSTSGALVAVTCDPETASKLAAAAGQMNLGIVLG